MKSRTFLVMLLIGLFYVINVSVFAQMYNDDAHKRWGGRVTELNINNTGDGSFKGNVVIQNTGSGNEHYKMNIHIIGISQYNDAQSNYIAQNIKSGVDVRWLKPGETSQYNFSFTQRYKEYDNYRYRVLVELREYNWPNRVIDIGY